MAVEIRLLAPGEHHVLDDVAPDVFDHPVDPWATRAFLTDPRHHIAVALDGGHMVGFASAVHYVHPDKAHPELWINEVGVAGSHRRRGIARGLLDVLLGVARQTGCAQAWVLTERSNAAAMALYASAGGATAPEDAVMYSFPLDAAAPPGEAVGATPPEIFETERLRLRGPRASDAETIFRRWTQDPEVTRYLVWRPHRSVTEAEAHIARCETGWRTGGPFVWLLEDRSSGVLVGSLAARPGDHGVNLGYLLARDAWGRGLMVEALRPVVEWWLGRPQVHRVWATCDPENRGSARVLEKAGFRLEGVLRRWEVHPNLGPEPRDALCYGRVRG